MQPRPELEDWCPLLLSLRYHSEAKGSACSRSPKIENRLLAAEFRPDHLQTPPMNPSESGVVLHLNGPSAFWYNDMFVIFIFKDVWTHIEIAAK